MPNEDEPKEDEQETVLRLDRELAEPMGESATDAVSLSDFETEAHRRLPRMVSAFIAGGAGDENTVRWNREAWDHIRLRPRVLADLPSLDTRVSLWGQDLPFPLLLAPTSYHRLIHPDGELATARGAGAAGATMVVSSSATTAIEEIARVAMQPLWFQLYVQPDRGFTRELVQRAEAAGCRALCVTVDAPVSGPQNRMTRARFALPPDLDVPMNPHAGAQRRRTTEPQSAVESFKARYPTTWADIDWLRSFTRIPVLLKGVLDSGDAEQAVRAGVSGIIVSNHGGRNLDTAPATAAALLEIARVVAGRVPLLVDGGIRRGTDVLKALALGASAALIGRPYLYGLAVDGAEGVGRVVEILRTELEMAMVLTGRASIAEIDHSVLWSPP